MRDPLFEHRHALAIRCANGRAYNQTVIREDRKRMSLSSDSLDCLYQSKYTLEPYYLV
jgi:hypothetical protein